jgi:hypothetical protein
MVVVGNRIYVKATASISDGTEIISANAFARESESKKGMDDSQLTGATSSYARKYALNGLFAIDDNKDADHPHEQNNGYQVITQAQVQELQAIYERLSPQAQEQVKTQGVVFSQVAPKHFVSWRDYLNSLLNQ